MPVDPHHLKPADLARLLNSSTLGTVISERQLHRHRTRAGFRIGDGRSVDLLRYLAWLLDQVHAPDAQRTLDGGYAAHREATADRAGRIAAAEGGTLFLDEIGELPRDLQHKLLRVLDQGALPRVGSDELVPFDVRFVAATHRDLEAAVREGTFRQDLYYRLCVLPFRVPPLRERPEEILPLAQLFLEREAPGRALDDEAIGALQAWTWPGNVRELKSRIARAGCSARGAFIRAEHLGLKAVPDGVQAAEPLDWEEAKHSFERRYVERVLDAAEGSVVRAAALAGMDRKNLYKKMKQHGMLKGQVQPPDRID